MFGVVLSRAAVAGALGCAIGCAAGLLCAFSDFGAHWLWLETWSDRAGLLVALIGLQAPFGAVAGGLLGVLFGATDGALLRASDDRLRCQSSIFAEVEETIEHPPI